MAVFRWSGTGWIVVVVFALSLALGQVLAVLLPRSTVDARKGWTYAAGLVLGAVAVYRTGTPIGEDHQPGLPSG